MGGYHSDGVWKVMVRNLSFILRAVKGFRAGRLTSPDYQSRRVDLQYGEGTGWQRDNQGGDSVGGCNRPGRHDDSPDSGSVVRTERHGQIESRNDRPGSCADVGE